MAANTRMATALQIMCVIAYEGPGTTTSRTIAKSLSTNPVVVQRILKRLQKRRLVSIRAGKDGGVELTRPPSKIALEEIYEALDDEPIVFALRPPGNPNCPVDVRMCELLTPIFGAANEAVKKILRDKTLGSLANMIRGRCDFEEFADEHGAIHGRGARPSGQSDFTKPRPRYRLRRYRARKSRSVHRQCRFA